MAYNKDSARAQDIFEEKVGIEWEFLPLFEEEQSYFKIGMAKLFVLGRKLMKAKVKNILV